MFKMLKDEFLAWKYITDIDGDDYIIQVRVPKGARYYQGPTGSKARVDSCYLHRVWRIDWHKKILIPEPEVYYLRHTGLRRTSAKPMTYRTGRLCKPDHFSTTEEICDSGIHVFWNFQSLVTYFLFPPKLKKFKYPKLYPKD